MPEVCRSVTLPPSTARKELVIMEAQVIVNATEYRNVSLALLE